mmetsp:Transcript_55058/g.120425  ORF Transcript_55058/g.120425 Transcript_55058/m.120425 type:complete len:228 (-) Transcript_55058:582-1265(-)
MAQTWRPRCRVEEAAHYASAPSTCRQSRGLGGSVARRPREVHARPAAEAACGGLDLWKFDGRGCRGRRERPSGRLPRGRFGQGCRFETKAAQTACFHPSDEDPHRVVRGLPRRGKPQCGPRDVLAARTHLRAQAEGGFRSSRGPHVRASLRHSSDEAAARLRGLLRHEAHARCQRLLRLAPLLEGRPNGDLQARRSLLEGLPQAHRGAARGRPAEACRGAGWTKAGT